MAKRYLFNPETLSFENQPGTPLRVKFARVLIFLVLSLLLSLGYELIYSRFFDTPKTIQLKKEYAELLLKYEFLQKKISHAHRLLSEVHLRDNNMYRAVLGLPEIPHTVSESSNSSNRYSHLMGFDGTGVAVSTSRQLNRLLKKTYLQTKSFDEVASLAVNMEEMAESVPAIQPVEIQYIRSIGRFGFRRDPVYGDTRLHEGMDFAGPVGLPVYATGNGKVVSVEKGYFGYGNLVEINHGFGYVTRYAHLQAALVRPGQRVKRGEKIALLGNTGKSTGSHLHYEVRYMGRPLDPVNFFTNDLSRNEYKKLVGFVPRD